MEFKTGNIGAVNPAEKNLFEGPLLASLARSAEKFTGDNEWREGIDDLLADLGRITGVSRVWIFQVLEINSEEITQDYTFEWAAASEYIQLGMPVFKKFTNKLGTGSYRQLIESRIKGEWQKVLTSELSDSWLKKSQVDQGIKSMLTIPIIVEKKLWGVLGFDDCERNYEWSDTEISLLRIAAFFISNSVLQNRLTSREKQFEILQQFVSTGAWQYDIKSRHLWSSARRFYPIDVVSENLHLSLQGLLRLVYKDDRRGLLNNFAVFNSSNKDISHCDLRIRDKNGRYHWVEIIGSLGRDSKGAPSKISGIVLDVEKRKEFEANLKKNAETDALTGALNKRMLEESLQRQIEKSRNRGTAFSLLLFDIDHFKKVNDTYGHIAGDKVLKQFVDLCHKNLREGDVFARVGGEEFSLILLNSSEEASCITGERFRKAIESNPAESGTIKYTVSIGCAEYNGVEEWEALYSRADRALYQAKANGRNCVYSFSETVKRLKDNSF